MNENENNNFVSQQSNNQIVGFDQLTGKPIFNGGIESQNQSNINDKETIEQKKVSKGVFIFQFALSFLVWNFVLLFVFELLIGSVVYQLFKNNAIMYILIYNILWIISSVGQIFITYWFNKSKTVEEYQLNSSRKIILILFYVFIIYINKGYILKLMDYNMILGSIMLILHMIIIWFVNDKLFYKYWGINRF